MLSANPLLAEVAWAVFDAAFYAAANPAARPLADEALVLAHYLAEGAAGGFSPNRWFDEAFYRRSQPDVDALIRCGALVSGFAHNCRIGAGTHAPHWLFDPSCYAEHNPALTEPVLKAAGFANAYDHFSRMGPPNCWVILVGSDEDLPLIERLLSALEYPLKVESAVGKTNGCDLAALISHCDLFIGNNSGPHHLASSMGVPTIGIHSGVVDAREWGPYGTTAVAIRKRIVCSPCYIAKPEDCPRALACLTQLLPEAIIKEVIKVLPDEPKARFAD